MDASPVADLDSPAADAATAAAGCPFPHNSAATACPVITTGDAERSKADVFMRRLLRIPDQPSAASDAAVYRTFQRSMFISAVRCTLTYVVFPFLLPAFTFMRGVGPALGIAIGSLALVCDVYTIRRFFAVDHKWRWHFSALAFAVMCLLVVLLVQDISHLLG